MLPDSLFHFKAVEEDDYPAVKNVDADWYVAKCMEWQQSSETNQYHKKWCNLSTFSN